MSTNVNPLAPIEVIHSSPEVLIVVPAVPQNVKTLIDPRSSAHRRPDPANGAPMLKNIRFFA